MREAVARAAGAGQPPLERELVAVEYPRSSPGGVAANLTLGFFGALFAAPLLWMLLASIDSHAGWSIGIPTWTASN